MLYLAFPYENTKAFCAEIFQKYGFSREESDFISDVLLRADLYGIESHGIQRLARYHHEIISGMVNVKGAPEIVYETPVSAVINAHKGMGQLIGKHAMGLAAAKAKAAGIGMIAVRNSNHYGIAGYYTGMAVESDLMGICMTNTEAIGVPTFGKRAMFGTNPIALAMPADPVPFSFDAATTVVPRGKLEVYNKNEKPLPDNWAVDVRGRVCIDAGEVLQNIINKAGGGIAPLGGLGELCGGHKGYGLGVAVDIFTAVLSGGVTSDHVNTVTGQTDICHYFAAVDYGLFGDKTQIRRRLSEYLQDLRNSDKAEGENRIYTHGEKEYESMREKLEKGIPVNEKTRQELLNIAAEQSVDYSAYFPGL